MIEKKRKNMTNIPLDFTRKTSLLDPIEISSLCFHFINQDPENKIRAMISGKRQREIGLVVPAKIIFTTNNKRYSEVLEKELLKRKAKFHEVKVKKHGSILLIIVLCFKYTPL